MAFEFNDLLGLLLMVFFAIPLAKSTNINCNGKGFHCLNSTHFMICVDLGNGISVTIDDNIIPCPPTTVCDVNNKYECEFPRVAWTPTPLHVIGVSANNVLPSLDNNKMSSQVEVSTTFPSNENNTIVTVMPLGEKTSPSKMEILESLKEEFTDGNEKIFDRDSIIPTSTIGYNSGVVSIYSSTIDNNTTSTEALNSIVQSTTEKAISNVTEMFVTDKKTNLTGTTTPSNDTNVENTPFVKIKRKLTEIPVDLMSTTITPFKYNQQTIELNDSVLLSSQTDNITSFLNKSTTSKVVQDEIADTIVTTENILSTNISEINYDNTTTDGISRPNTAKPWQLHQLHEVFINNQPVTEQSATTKPRASTTQQLLETTEVNLRSTLVNLDDIIKSRKSDDDPKPTLSVYIEHQVSINNNLVSIPSVEQNTSVLLPANGTYSFIKANNVTYATNESLSNTLLRFTTDNDTYANGNVEVNINTDFKIQNRATSKIPISLVKNETKLVISNDTYYDKNVFNSEPIEIRGYNNNETSRNLNDKYTNDIPSTPKNIPNFQDENKIAATAYEQISLLIVPEDSTTKLIETSHPERTTKLAVNTLSTSAVLPTRTKDENIADTEFILQKETILPTSTINLLYPTYDLKSTTKEPLSDNVNKLLSKTTTPNLYFRKNYSNNVIETVESTVPLNPDLTEKMVHHLTTTDYTHIKRLGTKNETSTSLSEITTINNKNSFENSMTEKPMYSSTTQADQQTTPTLNVKKYETYVTEIKKNKHISQIPPSEESTTSGMTKITPKKTSEIKLERFITPDITTTEPKNIKPGTESNSSSDSKVKVNNVDIIEKSNSSQTNIGLSEASVSFLNSTGEPSGEPSTNIKVTVDLKIKTGNNATRKVVDNKPGIENKVTALNEKLDLPMLEHSTKTYLKQKPILTSTLSPSLYTSPKLQQTAKNTLKVKETTFSTKFETEKPLLHVTKIINSMTMADEVVTVKHVNLSESPIRYRDTLQIELPPSTTEKTEKYSEIRSTEASYVVTTKPNIPRSTILTFNKGENNGASKFIQRIVNNETTLVTPTLQGPTIKQKLISKTSPNVLVSNTDPYIDNSRKMLELKTDSITILPKLRTESETDVTKKTIYTILSDHLAPSVEPDIYETFDSMTSKKSYIEVSTEAYSDYITDDPLKKRVLDAPSEVPFTIETTNNYGGNSTDSNIFDELLLTESISNINQFKNNQSHENVRSEYNLNSAKFTILSDREPLNQEAVNNNFLGHSVVQKDSINVNTTKFSNPNDREQLNQEVENNTFVGVSSAGNYSKNLDSAKISSQGALQNNSTNVNATKLSSHSGREQINQEVEKNTFLEQRTSQKDSVVLNTAKLSSLNERQQLNLEIDNNTFVGLIASRNDSINLNSAKLSSLSAREQLNQEAGNNTFVGVSSAGNYSTYLDSAKISSLNDREKAYNTLVVQGALQNNSTNVNATKLSSHNGREQINQEVEKNTFVEQRTSQKDSIVLNTAKLSSLNERQQLNLEIDNNTFVGLIASRNDSINLNSAKLRSLSAKEQLNQEAGDNTFVGLNVSINYSINLDFAKLSSLNDREQLHQVADNNTFVVQRSFQKDLKHLNSKKNSGLSDTEQLNQAVENKTFVGLSSKRNNSMNLNSAKLSSLNDRGSFIQKIDNNSLVRTQVNESSFVIGNNNSFNQGKYEPLIQIPKTLKVTSQIEQTTQGFIISNKNSVNNKSIPPLNVTNIKTDGDTKFGKDLNNNSKDILVKKGITNYGKKFDNNDTTKNKIDLVKNITELQDTVNVNVKRLSSKLQTFEAETKSRATLSNQMNDGPKVTTNTNNYIVATTDLSVSGSPFNCSNLTRGKYSDSRDCIKFYICLGNHQAVIGACPNGTVFSEINKQCTRNLSHCVRNNQFHCIDEGRFTDFLNDNIYYICVKHHEGFFRYKLQCQNGYYLNKALVKCVKNQVISRKLTSSISENSQINKDQNEETNESKKKENQEIDFECRKEGKFPFKGNCRKYFECSKNKKNKYRRKIKTCSDDEYYDKDNDSCKSGESNEC